MKNWCSILNRRWAVLRAIRGMADGWLFLRALVFALSVPLQMRLRLPVLNRLLARRFPGPDGAALIPEHGREIARCVEAAIQFGRPLVRAGCLTRGLTLYYFLRRARIGVTLCFGIRRRSGELVSERGHCWLELSGEPVMERSDPRHGFVSIFRLP